MNSVFRFSPIELSPPPQSSAIVNGWRVALSFGNHSHTRLIDLSHVSKWDLQDKSLHSRKPMGFRVPERPGGCVYEGGIMVSRLNHTQCAIWHLNGDMPELPDEPGYTDITDGLALVALCGRNTLAVMERISNLDPGNPSLPPPFLLQGPVLHIPCQVVRLCGGAADQTLIIGFSRGYGQAMAEAILAAGEDLGLAPGGMDDFKQYALS